MLQSSWFNTLHHLTFDPLIKLFQQIENRYLSRFISFFIVYCIIIFFVPVRILRRRFAFSLVVLQNVVSQISFLQKNYLSLDLFVSFLFLKFISFCFSSLDYYLQLARTWDLVSFNQLLYLLVPCENSFFAFSFAIFCELHDLLEQVCCLRLRYFYVASGRFEVVRIKLREFLFHQLLIN